MKVKFFSGIKTDGEVKKMVEFINDITITKEKIDNVETDVFEMLNPENNTMIRLEIFGENLTVFSGENTLFFELNKEIDNIFYNNTVETKVATVLNKLDIKPKSVSIEYDLLLKNEEPTPNAKIATYTSDLEFIDD
ncbi:Uncharacterised protein [Mesomycoplasma dispar]|uniref:Uncharacterized protein n=1 Tax=Mesomycoplasma dispar TaxID=86660 RepID=A0AAJ5NMA0_9BACT|nr:hypothetical protein [Mesomycoplasma dispar]AJR12054.1 hypothetical protein MDIS_01015 [Mesomycoplasma dispar]ATP59523.1 hypothetical protein CSW10_00955 [Mesomycoplasma dispar]VEU61394.1 Uncharacterised protein [Mesomycoplasma dispar]